MKQKAKIGVWGWWQGNNLGDNWIKDIMSECFPFAEMVPTSCRDFTGYDFMVCGGGGLFIYDVIPPWDTIEDFHVPYGMLGLGAEFPHASDIAARIEKNARFFFLRDQYSIDCMRVTQNARSYDCTFIRPLKWMEQEELHTDKVFVVWRDGQELVTGDERFKAYIQSGGNEWDIWKERIAAGFADCIEDDFQTDEHELEKRMEDCGFVISGRYHGIIAAIQKGLPFIAIDICPKIRALVTECGLEEYCIKISETEKIDALLASAKVNTEQIRQKELCYRTAAQEKMKQDLHVVYREIFKAAKPLTGIHYGAYWMKENDIVNVMADDLGRLCRLTKIDLKLYEEKHDRRVKCVLCEPNTQITILDHKKIMRDISRYQPDFVVLNSAGLVFEDETFAALKQRGVKTIGIELSDPDVFPYNGKLYAHKFDAFYTNAKYSYEHEYDAKEVNIGLMPFAASTAHHYPMPEIERCYDVVIVGHARPDRLETVRRLRDICKVGTYGDGWDESLGTVNGLAHVKAINSGRMYLSFSKTMAGYNNVKVGLFEAVACKQVVITEYMEELEDYFEIGKEILCFHNTEELCNIIKHYLTHPQQLEVVRENAYSRFLSEHTYQERWIEILRHR